MNFDSQLFPIIHRALGTVPRRILVTGGTGFVGSSLAEVLVQSGHQVTIAGRNRYRVPSSIPILEADISDEQQTCELCRDQEIVFHCAAWTSPWGSLEKHRLINTLGTKNVVDACRIQGVQRLVHVSSTSIFFRFADRDQVGDHDPFPREFCCHYAQSKAEAEGIVKSAMAQGLNAYIVRARAIFGPRDNALLPRLVQAARSGRLRQIGDGKNLCDLTYIDNLLAGLILAANPAGPIGTCTITNEEPVVLWELLRNLFRELKIPLRSGAIPYPLAVRLAHLAEWKHRLLRLAGEPTITRYGIGLLAKQQTFASKAAKSDLGYTPIVPVAVGVERTIRALKKRIAPVSDPRGIAVTVRFFSTGYTEANRNLAERGGAVIRTRFHAMVAVIKHPQHGVTLFDTGYHPRFFQATQPLPNRFYRWATHVHTNEHWTVDRWLQRIDIEPHQVQRVIVSHFHADHIGALSEFPTADFVTSRKAWEGVRGRRGVAAIRRAFLPELLPADFERRLHLIDNPIGPGFGEFDRCHDLFGDGTIRIFDLDGHARGQLGVLLELQAGNRCFLVADAYWTGREIAESLQPTVAYRMIAEDWPAALRTRRAIHSVRELAPHTIFIPTHCPQFAAEQNFDEQLRSTHRE